MNNKRNSNPRLTAILDPCSAPGAADLRPIETRYRGFRFRSRLEARWAVFFDAAGAAAPFSFVG
jgi:hypothetical protein